MINHYLKKLEYTTILDLLSHYAITAMGKEYCQALLPTSSIEKVAKLLQETSEGVSCIVQKKNPPFIPIASIDFSLKQLENNGILSLKALLEIAQVLKLAFSLKSYYQDNSDERLNTFPILAEYFSTLYTNPTIQEKILNSILDENTIADGASIELTHIRKKQRNLEENIKNKLNSFIHSNSYSKYMQENIVTIRNNRYVIPVKEEYRGQIKGFIHDTSASGFTVFMEPMIIFDMNNEINNLKADEAKEIEKILFYLSSLLYPISTELKENVRIIRKIRLYFC